MISSDVNSNESPKFKTNKKDTKRQQFARSSAERKLQILEKKQKNKESIFAQCERQAKRNDPKYGIRKNSSQYMSLKEKRKKEKALDKELKRLLINSKIKTSFRMIVGQIPARPGYAPTLNVRRIEQKQKQKR